MQKTYIQRPVKKLERELEAERTSGIPPKTIALNQLCERGESRRFVGSSHPPSSKRVVRYVPYLKFQLKGEPITIFMIDTGSEVNLIKLDAVPLEEQIDATPPGLIKLKGLMGLLPKVSAR